MRISLITKLTIFSFRGATTTKQEEFNSSSGSGRIGAMDRNLVTMPQEQEPLNAPK
jgi:hypothetical protein